MFTHLMCLIYWLIYCITTLKAPKPVQWCFIKNDNNMSCLVPYIILYICTFYYTLPLLRAQSHCFESTTTCRQLPFTISLRKARVSSRFQFVLLCDKCVPCSLTSMAETAGNNWVLALVCAWLADLKLIIVHVWRKKR